MKVPPSAVTDGSTGERDFLKPRAGPQSRNEQYLVILIWYGRIPVVWQRLAPYRKMTTCIRNVRGQPVQVPAAGRGESREWRNGNLEEESSRDPRAVLTNCSTCSTHNWRKVMTGDDESQVDQAILKTSIVHPLFCLNSTRRLDVQIDLAQQDAISDSPTSCSLTRFPRGRDET